MKLDLSEEQQILRDTTRRFLAASFPIDAVRALAEKGSGLDRAWWRRGAELGWCSMLVESAEGGGRLGGSGVVDLSVVAEEMGRLVSPGPLVPANLAIWALAHAGSAEQRALLGDLMDGQTVAAWCFDEPGGAWGPPHVQLTATPAGGDFVLHGSKSPVEGAAQADRLLVTARTEQGLTQFLVPPEQKGVSITALHSLDVVRQYATVHFDQVVVPASAVVGEVGGAEAQVRRQLHIGVVLQCAEMVGAADRVFDFTLQYAFDRYSFGRPLASYQALKHRFADMKLWLECAAATAAAAADAVDADTADADELVSVAKSYIGDHLPLLVQDCVQMHGGIGVTWDHDIHLYLRRLTVDRGTLGTPDDHRDRLATLLGV